MHEHRSAGADLERSSLVLETPTCLFLQIRDQNLVDDMHNAIGSFEVRADDSGLVVGIVLDLNLVVQVDFEGLSLESGLQLLAIRQAAAVGRNARNNVVEEDAADRLLRDFFDAANVQVFEHGCERLVRGGEHSERSFLRQGRDEASRADSLRNNLQSGGGAHDLVDGWVAEKNFVDDVDDAVGGVEVRDGHHSRELSLVVDGEHVAVDLDGEVFAEHGGHHVHIHEVGVVGLLGGDVVGEDVGEVRDGHVVKALRAKLVEQGFEGGVGGREDGERSLAAEGVNQICSYDRFGEQLEARGFRDDVDNGLGLGGSREQEEELEHLCLAREGTM
mmetsp:Transcript_27048/g.52723  ORF Transcript_27048/g.52723 Transcript_27048/m.52723 type:complete len:332 (-) Transcript_27048:57-1052(-)